MLKTRRSPSAAPRPVAIGHWLRSGVLVVALLPLLLKVPAAAEFSASILAYPFQVDDSEGVILSEAQWLARGVDPYQRARPDFFTAAPYTPIYTLLNAAAFAVGPFTFKVGRGLALLATVLVGLLIGGMVRWRTRNTLLAAWATLAVLTINLISVWSVRARPDHLALACNFAGFAVIWRAWPVLVDSAAKMPWRTLSGAAVLFALGFFTKQTMLAAAVAVGLALLLARPRRGLTFGALYGALVLLPFAGLTLLTRGGFYQHIVAFHSSWSAHDFLRLAQPFAGRYWPFLLAGALLPLAALVAAVRSPASHRTDPDLLPAIYLPVAGFFALGAGTHGGNHNHFVETLVAAIFCIALFAGGTPMHRAFQPGALALVLLLSLAGVGEARLTSSNWLERDFRTPRPLEREGWANVAAFVTNDPGPVYADNVGLLLVAGKEVRYTDPFSLAYAARTGQWDETALVGRIRRGEFSLIALRYDVFVEDGAPDDLTTAIFEAIRDRYRVIERNVVILYAPR